MHTAAATPPILFFLMYRYTVCMSFALSHTTRTYPKHIPYERMARDILGARYALSLVFVGEARAQALNKQYRHKEYYPNVLSFPLSDTEGEIYICPMVARREAKKFDMTVDGFIGYLFIHGLYHLKGHDHSDAMDAHEARAVKKYGLR